LHFVLGIISEFWLSITDGTFNITYVYISELTHDDGKLNAFQMGLNAMPEAHFQTLKHLIFHLGRYVTIICFSSSTLCKEIGVIVLYDLIRGVKAQKNSRRSNSLATPQGFNQRWR